MVHRLGGLIVPGKDAPSLRRGTGCSGRWTAVHSSRGLLLKKRYWIVTVLASPRVEAKLLQSDHGRVTLDEIREAVAFYNYEEARWDDHPIRCPRLFVDGRTNGGRRILVILGIEDEENGVWRLRSAWVK